MEKNILSLLDEYERKVVDPATYKKGDILFREGDVCNCVTIIVSGEIKISSFNFDGNEVIYNILKKNEIFGNNLVYSDNPFYKGDVVAMKDSTVVHIKRECLIGLLQNNTRFLTSYLKIQSNFGRKLNSTIKLLSFNSVEDRLRYYLYINRNKITFKSVTELASILHVQRETLSRLLTKLEKENAIQRSPHQIELIN